MGMDVFGKNPKAPEGEYFRRNVWGWHPLADLVTDLCPEETADCKYWHSNDGDGLDAGGATRLAGRLQHLIEGGRVRAYRARLNDEFAALSSETLSLRDCFRACADEICGSVSQAERTAFVDTRGCNGQNGIRIETGFAPRFHVKEDDVREFVAFLRASGGFEIL